ncbi:MAG TPA: hypothetical protein VGE26_08250 [Sphingobacteriaceae bacterium]
MHVEFPSHFGADLKMVIDHLKLEANIFDSFSSTGETVVLSAEREELEKIVEADGEDFQFPNDNVRVSFKNIRAIVRAHLGD